MIKLYTVYSIFLVVLLTYANYRGYVFSNIFGSESHTAQSSNQYHK
jgi:hypothetical protein